MKEVLKDNTAQETSRIVHDRSAQRQYGPRDQPNCP